LGLGGSSEDMTAVLPRRVVFEKEKKMKIGLGVETNKNSTAINKSRKRRKRTKTQTTTRIVQLSLSDSHGVALDQNGNVWTWGSAPSLGRRCVFWIVLVFCRSCMCTLFQGFWIFQVFWHL